MQSHSKEVPVTLDNLKECGIVLTTISTPDTLGSYLMSAKRKETYDDWSIVDSSDFPPEILDSVRGLLGDGLSEFGFDLKVKIDEWRQGHSLCPHGDMSVYSPFVAQLFYILPEATHEGSDILFGREDSSEIFRARITSGDVALFYTHPNNFVTAFTELKSNHRIYVINFFASLTEDIGKCWIFRDVEMPQWGAWKS